MSLWRHKVRPMMQFFSIFLHFISVFYGNMVRFSHAASHTSLYIRRSVLLRRSGGGVLVVHDKIKYCDMRYTVAVGWSIDFTVLLWMRESWMRESWMRESWRRELWMRESWIRESENGKCVNSECVNRECVNHECVNWEYHNVQCVNRECVKACTDKGNPTV